MILVSGERRLYAVCGFGIRQSAVSVLSMIWVSGERDLYSARGLSPGRCAVPAAWV
jgi:hypothetical protein